MQIKSLRLKSYRSWRIDERNITETARFRLKKLKQFWLLREQKCEESTIFKIIEVKRSTIYRWQSAYRQSGLYGLNPDSKAPKNKRQPQWNKHLEQQVLHLRKQYPIWGKKTLTTILNRDRSQKVSESTIGRILGKLIATNKIKPVCFYYGKLKPKLSRNFNKHAKRWKKGMKSTKPGEMIQVDHMSVSVLPGRTIKHFEAICPITKITIAQTYTDASSRTAAKFLALIREKLPFPLISIQVDGGSEFRKDFEDACEEAQISLIVLPPSSPELNGCVERCNRTLRYEFYRFYDGSFDLFSIRQALAGYMNIYNTFRPHQALQQATPLEYYQQHYLGGL